MTSSIVSYFRASLPLEQFSDAEKNQRQPLFNDIHRRVESSEGYVGQEANKIFLGRAGRGEVSINKLNNIKTIEMNEGM